MKRRAAFSLTELLITMSAGSMLTMVAVGSLHQAMHLTAGARGRAVEQQTLSRLADQFRHDVHRANEIVMQSPDVLRLSVPGVGEVSYVAEPGGCIRTVPAQSADPGDSPQIHRQQFRLQTGATIRFEQLEQPRRAALIGYQTAFSEASSGAQPDAEDAIVHAPQPLVQIEAVVGRLLQVHGQIHREETL